MGGKAKLPEMSWEDVDRFPRVSTPMRRADPAGNSFRAQKVDSTTFRPMAVEDHIRLARAPKLPRGAGTNVTMYSYEIPGLPGPAEHAYVEFDDGRERLIARGGPSESGPALLGAALGDRLRVTGGVAPAYLSRDEGKGTRLLFRGTLPGLPARVAARGAERRAEDLARDPRRYTAWSNSNSYAGDVIEELFRARPADRSTPGSAYPLSGARRQRPLDISPALRGPSS